MRSRSNGFVRREYEERQGECVAKLIIILGMLMRYEKDGGGSGKEGVRERHFPLAVQPTTTSYNVTVPPVSINPSVSCSPQVSGSACCLLEIGTGCACSESMNNKLTVSPSPSLALRYLVANTNLHTIPLF